MHIYMDLLGELSYCPPSVKSWRSNNTMPTSPSESTRYICEVLKCVDTDAEGMDKTKNEVGSGGHLKAHMNV